MTVLYVVYSSINDWTFEADKSRGQTGAKAAVNQHKQCPKCIRICIFIVCVCALGCCCNYFNDKRYEIGGEIWERDRQHETLIHLFVSCIIASAAVEQLVKNSGAHLLLSLSLYIYLSLSRCVSFACGNCVSFVGHLPFTTNVHTVFFPCTVSSHICQVWT